MSQQLTPVTVAVRRSYCLTLFFSDHIMIVIQGDWYQLKNLQHSFSITQKSGLAILCYRRRLPKLQNPMNLIQSHRRWGEAGNDWVSI